MQRNRGRLDAGNLLGDQVAVAGNADDEGASGRPFTGNVNVVRRGNHVWKDTVMKRPPKEPFLQRYSGFPDYCG